MASLLVVFGQSVSFGIGGVDGKESGRWKFDSFFNHTAHAGCCSHPFGADGSLGIPCKSVDWWKVEAAQLVDSGGRVDRHAIDWRYAGA